MPSDGESICDMENGFCVNCSFNTMGSQCEQCLPGYFGDPTGVTKCSGKCMYNMLLWVFTMVFVVECTCHVNGTRPGTQCENNLERGVGICDCKPGTNGSNCDRCSPGHWGLHLGGCRPCECCPNGSVNESCDQVSTYL